MLCYYIDIVNCVYLGIDKMDLEKKQQIEQAINNPALRIRMTICNPKKVSLLKMLDESLKDNTSASTIDRIFKALKDNIVASEQPEIDGLYNLYNKYLKQAVPAEKLLKNIKELRLNEDLKFLYSKAKSPEEIEPFLAKCSAEEKSALLKALTADYHNHDYDDMSFLKMNSVLKHFNRCVKREILGVVESESVTTSDNENQMLRCIAAGKFFMPQDENNNEDFTKYSPAYNYFRSDDGVSGLSYKDYKLLNNNPLWKKVKNSHNIQKIAKDVEIALAKLGIPPELANQFNSYDFAKIMSSVAEQRNPAFAKINPDCVDSPYCEFCKNLLKDKDVLEAIKQDFKKNNIDEKYTNAWINSMINDGNPNPDISELNIKGKIPAKISIHHKNHLQYAPNLPDSLMINNTSNFLLAIKFDKEDPHEEEHLGDSRGFLYVNENKNSRNDPSIIKTNSPTAGMVAVAEKFEYDDGNGKDTRAYISPSCTICSNISGNSDLVKGTQHIMQATKMSSVHVA